MIDLKDYWTTDRIIGAGLIITLFLIVIADLVIALINGEIRSTELPGNIVSGLVGFLGRDLLEKVKKSTDKKGDDNA